MTNENNMPDMIQDTADKGDETARRYRYQWYYAAISCCSLLDDSLDISEVFCEQHEDILLKHEDGTFTGLQVKTRATDQPAWRTSDEPVKKSCARFISLEEKFPDKFRAFRFLTNHPLHSTGNGADLAYVLSEISKAKDIDEVTGVSRKFLKTVARQASCELNIAFKALKKTTAGDSLPKLADVLMRLVNTLVIVWPDASNCSFDNVVQVARELIEECGRASSIAHEETLPSYIPIVTGEVEIKVKALIENKRIDKEGLLSTLESGLNQVALLDNDPDMLWDPSSGTTELLKKKLTAGGFSVVSLNSAEDLRNKADYLGISWTQKYGRVPGLQKYDHLRSLVLRDCATAFEESKSGEVHFGNDMLSELHTLFAQRRSEKAQLFDCSNEHLEGVAFSLTSECKVQWSIDSPWEEDDDVTG